MVIYFNYNTFVKYVFKSIDIKLLNYKIFRVWGLGVSSLVNQSNTKFIMKNISIVMFVFKQNCCNIYIYLHNYCWRSHID